MLASAAAILLAVPAAHAAPLAAPPAANCSCVYTETDMQCTAPGLPTDPPCDPDPSGRYTGDGGDEETAYGVRCLEYFLRHPNGVQLKGTATSKLTIMFNWGLVSARLVQH